MAQFYIPFDDAGLIDGATFANERRNTDKCNGVYAYTAPKSGALAKIDENEPLLILAHGTYFTADKIGGLLKDNKVAYLTAEQLADQMLKDDKLPPNVSDVRLLACWSGYKGGTYEAAHTVERTEGKAPFAGQLSSALKGAGCKRVIITGYTGEIYLPSREKTVRGMPLNLKSVAMDRTGQPGGTDFEKAVGDANQSLFDILQQIVTDRGKRATDVKTRTVWL